jgi:CBS domain-containing protein
MRIEALMTLAPKTCASTDALHKAAQIMWENDCGVVPVVEAQGKLVGLVTDRDVCMAAYTQGAPLHTIPVASVMAKLLYTLGPKSSVEDATRLMSERQVRRLPVVDAEGALIGILSLSDIARSSEGKGRARAKASSTLLAVQGVSRPRRASAVPQDLIVPAARKKSASRAPAPAAPARKRVAPKSRATAKRKG